MSTNSTIEWTQTTWNPVTGCDAQGLDLKLRPERLQPPFRWRKPRRVLANGMSDPSVGVGAAASSSAIASVQVTRGDDGALCYPKLTRAAKSTPIDRRGRSGDLIRQGHAGIICRHAPRGESAPESVQATAQ